MSKIFPPVNFMGWINENRDRLKPPVCNQVVWEDTEYIIMVVGGPNNRKDYHFNETPEFFYQVEGDMVLKIIDNGEFKDIDIKEGEIFFLPPKVSHSPQRKTESVGLVIESKREEGVMDALEWYCESCGYQLHRAPFELENIVTQMPIAFDKFYGDQDLLTCDQCAAVMEPPKKIEKA